MAATGKAAPTQSLINYVPLILGKQLDDKIIKANFADLQPCGNYMTDYGLATEALNSSKYQYDGYWRGPIWAPPTYQIFWGAVNAGETAYARTLAERFCNLCALDVSFSENYDAPSGKAVQAHGVCWTPAVFMLMAYWLTKSSVKPA